MKSPPKVRPVPKASKYKAEIKEKASVWEDAKPQGDQKDNIILKNEDN